MKKNKLIELLQKIEGNPDIFLWNGYVEDFVDIENRLVDVELVKHDKKHIETVIKNEYLRDYCREGLSYQEAVAKLESERPDIQNEVDTAYKKYHSKWELPNRYLTEEQVSEWYSHRKTVFLLQAKTMGKSSTDRVGTTYY
jgi:hypothetical protein